MSLQTGLITQKSYLDNLKSPLFSDMEKFNDNFLLRNQKELATYHSKWTNDSLHNWSRQFEYPFFFDAIEQYVKANPDKKTIKVLDAGSGLTFFPYAIGEKFPQLEIVCTDYDSILVDGFKLINSNEKTNVTFVQADLRERAFKENEFDIIYCVSVLEHTNAYKKIIENFNFYLKSGGSLVLSFDLSLDGERDIPVDEARDLTKELNKYFSPKTPDALPAAQEIKQGDFLTIDFIKKFDSKLLPWRSPYKNFLWCLKNFKYPRFYFNLAFYCQIYKKV